MATKVHMEALSPTMEEGQLVRWLKSEGDEVSSGDVLAEIETDKATMELVARGDGVLRRILLPEGGTSPVGDVIALIAAPDEDISELVAAAGETAEEATASEETPGAQDGEGEDGQGAEAEVAAPAPEEEVGAATAKDGSRVKASPLARRLAAEARLDLARIEGSGPGGRVIKRDVEAARAAGPTVAAGVPAAQASGERVTLPEAEGPDFEDVPLSQMRKTIAKRLVESMGPVPHFFLRITVDMTRIQEVRSRMNDLLAEEGGKVSINDVILKITASALARHPEVNAQWAGEAIRRHRRVHLGVAVAVEDGLITPVIRDADRKGIARIGQEVRELSARARDKRLEPAEYTGATFSVSNLGMFGIHEFTGVINPPEAGILAVGAIEDTPVVVDGEVVVRPLMKVTMSCDHRVIDGATGARFLRTLKTILEDPAVALA